MKILGRGLVLAGLLAAPAALSAQSLTIVAPAAPGGGWDQTARVMQQALVRVEPGLVVQVENVPGAAGTIGLARFVSAERGSPDALLVTGLVMLSGIVTNGSPVTLRDATPIARLTGEPEVIVVPAASPFRTLDGLLDAFRAAPGAVSWGGGSAGGTDDLLVRLLAEAVGVPPASVNYIAFPGGGAALAAVLGGQVTAGVSGLGEFIGQIEAGQLRALALSAPSRLEGAGVPTLEDAGIPLQLSNWRAVVAPPGVTDAERDRLTARVEAMARSSAWQAALERNGWTDQLLTGPAFRQFLLAEQARVEAVLRRLVADPSAAAPTAFAVTPMTLPLAVIAVLAALTLLVAIERWRGAVAAVESAAEAAIAAGTPGGRRRLLLVAAALLLQAVVMPWAGFVPVATGVFAVTARALGSRATGRDLLVGLALALIVYVTFTRGLGVALPAGPFGAGWA